MPVAVPIRDMRDTAKFSELVESSPTPVIVTKNGYSKFVVMRSEDYDELAAERAKARLMSRIAVAERERAAHAGVDAFEFLNALKEEHGL